MRFEHVSEHVAYNTDNIIILNILLDRRTFVYVSNGSVEVRLRSSKVK